MTNDERKRRISEAWFEHLRKYPTSSQNPVIQHRLVFSMSREMHDKLVEAGINPDRVLQTTTKKIMGKFNERFHPADSIGYAYGIHHDTDNLHVHIALCPRTARGAYVGAARHGTWRRDTRTRWNSSARASSGRTSAGNRFSPCRKSWRSTFPGGSIPTRSSSPRV
jgi:hypothetical protein